MVRDTYKIKPLTFDCYPLTVGQDGIRIFQFPILEVDAHRENPLIIRKSSHAVVHRIGQNPKTETANPLGQEYLAFVARRQDYNGSKQTGDNVSVKDLHTKRFTKISGCATNIALSTEIPLSPTAH